MSWQRVNIPSYGADEEPLLYMLEMQEPPYNDWRRVAEDLRDTTYYVTGLQPATDYRFRVRARTPEGVITEPSPAASLYRTIGNLPPPILFLMLLIENSVWKVDSFCVCLHVDHFSKVFHL